MNYFFVFQNKSYNEEKKGSFLWAPKSNKEGMTFHHWTSMQLIKKGDIIFNSYNGELLSIITAKSDYYDSFKPTDLESVDLWENDGWRVDARYTEVKYTIKYKDYMEDILALQGNKYAPFNSAGRGNTGYLFQITNELANFFFSLTRLNLSDLVEPLINDEQLIQNATVDILNVPETTVREQLVQNRVGQGIFKERLIKLDPKCKICGINNLEFLRASHSKPWSVSTNQERLDKFNGFLLCPAHDVLYDRGYITFQDDGLILISRALDNNTMILLNVHDKMRIKILEGHLPYLQYHRDNIFKVG